MTWREVAELSAGLHALTGPATGPIAAIVRAGDRANARRMLDEWRDVFGDRLAVEVQLHYTGGAEGALAGALVDLAERRKIPWVVAHDPRYIDNDGRLVHDALTALRYNVDLDTAHQGRLPPSERRVAPALTRGDGASLARPRARDRGERAHCRRVRRFRARLDAAADADVPRARPPHRRELPRGARAIGATERWGDTLSDAQEAQIENELGVIGRLGFSGFFLVMWDAVHYAQRNGILCQGRGSAANSVVAYLLGITAVDPVRHGLLFERFLSEKRTDGKTEPPDIDVDFEHDRREEVLDYVYDKYERAKAAITCTVQNYRAPNAVQDAMRAFGYPAELAFKFSKRVHYAEPADAVTAMREGLAKRFELDIEGPRGRALLAAIGAFDGLPRLRSTHVGGFVLSSESLGDYMPIEQTTMGRTIIQFDKDDLDLIGVPKYDFLGLGALSLVRYSFDEIERRTGSAAGDVPHPARRQADLRPHLPRRDDRHVPDREPSADRVHPAHDARAALRHRRAGRAHPPRPHPGEVRPPVHAAAARPGRGVLSAPRPPADPRAHAGYPDLPGAGDGRLHGVRRLQRRRSRRAAPDDGPHAEEGQARGGAREAPSSA